MRTMPDAWPILVVAPPCFLRLVRAGGRLARLELLQVVAADAHLVLAARVLVQAPRELHRRVRAHPPRLVLARMAVARLQRRVVLRLLRLRRRAGPAAEEATNGVPDRRADRHTAVPA